MWWNITSHRSHPYSWSQIILWKTIAHFFGKDSKVYDQILIAIKISQKLTRQFKLNSKSYNYVEIPCSYRVCLAPVLSRSLYKLHLLINGRFQSWRHWWHFANQNDFKQIITIFKLFVTNVKLTVENTFTASWDFKNKTIILKLAFNQLIFIKQT